MSMADISSRLRQLVEASIIFLSCLWVVLSPCVFFVATTATALNYYMAGQSIMLAVWGGIVGSTVSFGVLLVVGLLLGYIINKFNIGDSFKEESPVLGI